MGVILAQAGTDFELLSVMLERYGLFGVMALFVAGILWYSSRNIQQTQLAYSETQKAIANIAISQQAQTEKQDARNAALQAEVNELRTKAARSDGAFETLQKTLDGERLSWNSERSKMAAEIATLRESIRQHEKTIEQLRALIESKTSENSQLLANNARLESQLDAKVTLVKELHARIETLERQLASQAALITQQSKDIEELKREREQAITRINGAGDADGIGGSRPRAGNDPDNGSTLASGGDGAALGGVI